MLTEPSTYTYQPLFSCYLFSSSFSAHSPDNLFLGFVVDKATNEDAEGIPDEETKSNKPIGVLYAKDAMYLQVSLDRKELYFGWKFVFFKGQKLDRP